MALAPIRTRFFTFYSFKGGVGRSMAVYNCACVLAGSGRRVLMIDFDLEAPGLTFLFQRRLAQAEKRKPKKRRGGPRLEKQPGVIELVTDFVENPTEWPLGKADDPARLDKYVADLPISRKVRVKGVSGRLALMPAGAIGRDFETRLGRVHWDAPPLAKRRDDLFRHVRELIIQGQAYDYVLIDARTGFSDEGYLSARILADDLVVLSGLNDQNVIGTARFLKHVDSWRPHKGNDPHVILIGSPVPEFEEEAKQKRLTQVRALFKEHTGRPLDFTLTLPYHPRLALYEEEMVADLPDSGLARAYRGLTGMLRDLAADDAVRWTQEAFEALRAPESGPGESPRPPDLHRALDALETLRTISPEVFEQVASAVGRQVASIQAPLEEARLLLTSLSALQPDEPDYPLSLVRLLRREGAPGDSRDVLRHLDAARKIARRTKNRPVLLAIEIERGEVFENAARPADARAAFLEARKRARATNDTGRLCEAEIRLAALAEKQGQPRRAANHYRRAIAVARQSGNQSGLANSLRRHGQFLRHTGRWPEAKAAFEEAFGIFRALGDRRGIAVVLHDSAELHALQGDYQIAELRYTEALEMKRALGDRRGIAVTLNALAQLDVLEGEYAKARQGYTEALEMKRALGDSREIAVTLHGLAELDRLEGEYAKARQGYTDALEMRRALRDRTGISATVYALAELDRLQGEHAKARQGYTESLAIDRALGDRHGISVTLHAVAQLDRSEGEYAKARQGYTKALEIERALGDRPGIAITEFQIQLLDATESGEGEPARLRAALEALAEVTDPYSVARRYVMLGELGRARGDIGFALEALDECLGLCAQHSFRGVEADARALRSVLLAEGGDEAAAAEDARQAVAFFEEQHVRSPLREQLEAIIAASG